MSKVTITLTPEDVITLREVFSLALVQSEASLDDTSYTDLGDAYRTHNAVVSLMARMDAMLPDSTGFFDD